MHWSLALVLAAIVTAPFLLTLRVGMIVFIAVVSFLANAWIIFGALPNTAGPLWGEVGLLCMWELIAVGIAGSCLHGWTKSDSVGFEIAAPLGAAVLSLVVMCFIGISNSIWARTADYAALVPPIEQHEWSRDFQPKDPRHFRVSSAENADYLAGRALGQSTTLDSKGAPVGLGSQFSVQTGKGSIQIIRGELWTIVPIDWSGTSQQWNNNAGVPGYIRVSGENAIIPAEYVKLSQGKSFRYTPESIFDGNLERLVWKNHMDKIIADIHLEIDDEGQPHYIVSMAQPTIGWWGEKVVGAVIIDPFTGAGADKLIPLGQIPSWVDRVEAQYIVHRNIDLHSKYSQGYWNRSISKINVLTATETHFGYGSDGEPVFATGVKAHSSNTSDSLVAVYYTDTRTGKTVEYEMNGGTTEAKAIEQCNLIGDVRNQQYHSTTPQLYNVYGRIAYVAPLQNATHAFAGVCIVDVNNPQVIAWGKTAINSELAFKQLLATAGSQLAVSGVRKVSTITGTVKRIGTVPLNGSATVFVWLVDSTHLFTIPFGASNALAVTEKGDTVKIEFFDSGEEVMPIESFENTNVVLTKSRMEQETADRANAHLGQVRTKANERTDIQGSLEKLPPEEADRIRRALQSK